MTLYPAVTAMPSNALPTPNQMATEDDEPFLSTPWPLMGGAIQYRNRRGGSGNAHAFEFVLQWDRVDLPMLDAISFHYKTYYHGDPFELVLPCGSTPERLEYVGPLNVERITTYSRVTVRVRRALAASTT